MSKPKSTALAELLQSVLQDVRKDAGYHTDLGLSVYRGFYAHAIKAQDARFPLVAIHPPVEVLRSVRANTDAVIASDRPIIVADKLGHGEGAFDQIEAALADVRRAIHAARDQFTGLAGRDDFELGTAEPELTRDTGFILYAMPLSVAFTEHY